MTQEEELKELKEKATKKGWKQGQHIFNYLNEVDMFKYDNLKEEKGIQQCKQDVIDIIEKELLGEITFSEKGYKLWLGIKSKINNKGDE